MVMDGREGMGYDGWMRLATAISPWSTTFMCSLCTGILCSSARKIAHSVHGLWIRLALKGDRVGLQIGTPDSSPKCLTVHTGNEEQIGDQKMNHIIDKVWMSMI